MGVARKWHFSTSGGAAKLGGVSGDLSEHRGSGITLLGITSLNRHFYAQIDWTNIASNNNKIHVCCLVYSVLYSIQYTL